MACTETHRYAYVLRQMSLVVKMRPWNFTMKAGSNSYTHPSIAARYITVQHGRRAGDDIAPALNHIWQDMPVHHEFTKHRPCGPSSHNSQRAHVQGQAGQVPIADCPVAPLPNDPTKAQAPPHTVNPQTDQLNMSDVKVSHTFSRLHHPNHLRIEPLATYAAPMLIILGRKR